MVKTWTILGVDHMDESLKAQLNATLDMIPAFTWYAEPSGALLFVNSRCADYLGLPQDHPLRFGTDRGSAWDSHIPFSASGRSRRNAESRVGQSEDGGHR